MLASVISAFKSTIQQTTGEVRMSPELERQYLAHKSRQVLQQRRLAMFLAVALWTVFIYWDFSHHRSFETFSWLIGLRIGGAVFLTACFATAFTDHFFSEQFAEGILLVATAVAWMGILAMMLASPAPNNYLDYYAGLPLVYVYLFSFLWIRVGKALPLGIALLIAFNCVEWYMYSNWANFAKTTGVEYIAYQTDFRYYWGTAAFYITSFLMLGTIVSYQLERSLRVNFVRERELAEQTSQRESQSLVLLNLKEQQRQQAMEANEKKSGFLAAAAHDLRQPLMALGAMMEALEHSVGNRDLETSEQHVAQARRSLRALRATMNAVLEISRLESGFVTPDYSEFDAVELLAEVCEPLSLLARNKEIEFRLRLPASVRVLVRSDRALLGRLMTNLVANAVKYTPLKPGHRAVVLVGLVRLGNRVRIDVYDSGIGISHEHQDAIFRPFFQIGNRERDREKGLGLGLSIVAQIVAILDQHRLDFSSIPERGSRFSLELPVFAVEFAEAQGQLAELDVTTASLEGSYVLVIEDDILVRRALTAALQSWGVIVEACEDLNQVSDFLRIAERYPDAILTDFSLPDDRNAYDVIREVRESLRRMVPAIILTGELGVTSNADVPVAAVISKPADMKTLKSILASCLMSTSPS